MSDYSQGKIYKIISSECDDVYYGSTVLQLNQRLALHKHNYKKYLKGITRFVTSFKIIESGNYEIVLVENYPCNSKKELELRERFYIENNECVNKFIPGRTKKEYEQDNRERIRERKNKKIICNICGSEISKRYLSLYKKSKKCLEHNNIINI
jgi:hypothetical protein